MAFCLALTLTICCSMSAETQAAPNSGALSVTAFQYGTQYELVCDECGKTAPRGAREGDACTYCSKSSSPRGIIALVVMAVVGVGRLIARAAS